MDNEQMSLLAGPAVRDARRMVGRNHPNTAQAMQRKVLPKSGTLRGMIYDALLMRRSHPIAGLTDDELERLLGRSHQSVSGARATLKADGWVTDSGLRRANRYGNLAIVWMATDGLGVVTDDG